MVLDPLEQLVAEAAIRQLAARYAVLLDARDLDGLVALFVDDVTVGDDQGRAALKENFAAQLAPLGVTVLHIGGHVIEVDDADHAHGIVTCLADIERDGGRIVQHIQYHDTYERRDGQWLFRRRRHLLVYDGDVRGPLPEMLDTYRAFAADRHPGGAS
jgi:ketosteroid isomerase-like protein